MSSLFLSVNSDSVTSSKYKQNVYKKKQQHYFLMPRPVNMSLSNDRSYWAFMLGNCNWETHVK